MFSGWGGLTTIGSGLTALGHPGQSFGFAGFSYVSLFALIKGAFCDISARFEVVCRVFFSGFLARYKRLNRPL
jgi:hypothetical protein